MASPDRAPLAAGSVDAVAARALRALIPPPRIRMSAWVERHVVLPAGVSAQPGRVQLWPFQREIADAIGDPDLERVSVLKSARVGYSSLLVGAVAGFVANDPAPILVVVPTEADARTFVVSGVEPIFAASPAVADALDDDREEGKRNTLLARRFAGGSLRIVAAKAPRNLRAHTARVLFLDEVDGMEVTAEGSPVLLAEKRTLSFANRKIVLGSTPTREDTSLILRAWAQSDQRVFEVPCPACGAFAEITWAQIVWDDDRPETARRRCPDCEAETPEAAKPAMVAAGHWRATRPEVRGHAGFRLNALVSPHANAAWGKLAAEFLAAKDDPALLQVFVNTVLGEAWRGEGEELAEADLVARAEPGWGLDAGLPAEALVLTAGVDVQHDRLEASFLGWGADGTAFALGHVVVWGQWDDPATWSELDHLLGRRWAHALGGTIPLDAVAIDAGDGTTMKAVTDFTAPRTRRRIVAIKGAAGFSRPLIERAAARPRPGTTRRPPPLWIVGVDTGKTWLLDRLARPGVSAGPVRFSAELPEVWYEQLTSERSVVRMSRGAPSRRFERIPGRRAEALDCVVYALAARQLVQVPDWDARRGELALAEPPPARPAPVLQSGWMARR